MKIFTILAILLFSTFTVATESSIEITANKQHISLNKKQHTFIGNVKVTLLNQDFASHSSKAHFKNGTSIMEGDVEIILADAIVKTDKVVIKSTDNGLIAEMDEMTLMYTEL